MINTQELSDIESRIIANAATSPAPVLVHMLGIPGSGKSSFLKMLQTVWADHYDGVTPTLLGFDQIMQSMPSYQKTANKIDGFDQFELPARAAGYRILEGLLKKGVHILFDNGGSADSHPKLMREARDSLGYRLIFVSIETNLVIARSRVDVRAVEIGQHTPLHYLEERQKNLQKLIRTYRALADRFFVIENNDADIDIFQQKSRDVAREICEFI